MFALSLHIVVHFCLIVGFRFLARVSKSVQQLVAAGAEDEASADSGRRKVVEVLEEVDSAGDGFGAVKPWIGALVPPSDSSSIPTTVPMPNEDLELRHVFG